MLVESKSNLARLMATENLLVEQRQVSTAFFDIKNRVLTVPVLDGNLSPELYDLLLGHEVGHALETPEQGWHDSVVDLKVNRSILNVCEDARIEKKIKRKFPGIRISFVKGYRELMEMDFFGVKNQNLNSLNFIDRINLYTKGGAAQGIDFTSEEYELVREVENAETFEETVAIAMKIQKFMKENADTKSKVKQFNPNEESGETGNDPMDFDSNDSKDQEKSESTPKEGVSKNQELDVSEDSGDSEKEEKLENPSESIGSGSAGSDSGNFESKTDNSFREKEKELYSKNNKDILYANIPDVILNNILVDYKTLISEVETHNSESIRSGFFYPEKMRQNYNKFRSESNKVVSYLVKEFEMRKNAEQQSRVSVSKTGELNMSKIHEYKFTDDIFARLTKVPNGKSHGLVMFVDWSGSMCDHMSPTVKQLLNLVMFCKKVNIPYEVYAFSTNIMKIVKKSPNYDSVYTNVMHGKPGDISITPFSLLNILSHKMSVGEFTKMASFLLDFGQGRRGTCRNMEPPEILELSGTPLNETLIAAFKLIPEFKTENRLQIVNTVVLTDGEGSGLYGRVESIRSPGCFETSNINTNWKTRVFLRDPVTKASVEISDGGRWNSRSVSQTISLLKLLKQRTDANVVGFYIAKPRDVRHALEMYTPEDSKNKFDIEKRVVDFRKNNFTFLNNVGYDEYYFLRSDKLDTDEDDEFEVTSTTTRGLVSAFSKYTGNRVSNRIVLNRFINLIA